MGVSQGRGVGGVRKGGVQQWCLPGSHLLELDRDISYMSWSVEGRLLDTYHLMSIVLEKHSWSHVWTGKVLSAATPAPVTSHGA
jgi:hypothetical protein